MKSVAKYFIAICVIIFVYSVFKEKKQYIVNSIHNIYKKDDDPNISEIWSVYLTKDYRLVLCNNTNRYLRDVICCSSEFLKGIDAYYNIVNDDLVNNLKIGAIDSCMDLLTYIMGDNYKDNLNTKVEAHSVFHKTLMMKKDFQNILSKTYIELKSDKNLMHDVRLARHQDINIIKKNNIYAITLGNRTINIIFELEVLLDNLERKNINTKPHRNYLKMLTSNK